MLLSICMSSIGGMCEKNFVSEYEGMMFLNWWVCWVKDNGMFGICENWFMDGLFDRVERVVRVRF